MSHQPHLFALTLALALAPAMGSAQQPQQRVELSLTGQPDSFFVEGGAYVVTGYGKARFGMTVEEVRALIGAEYPAALPTLRDEVHPVDRTRDIGIVVPAVAPGPGPATINFVFGATSRRLIAVNVYWLASGNPSDAERQRLVDAAKVLAAGVSGYRWPFLSTARGHVVAPGRVIVFVGKDEAGAGIEIRLDGVALDIERRQAPGAQPLPPERRAAPPGPAQLRISFVANVDRPDVYRIPAGTF